ncbi:MAG: JAB domain-containing protein [Thermonemataceae bacterium]
MNVRLTEAEKVKILNSEDVYTIMQQVLLRENKISRSQEHFWVMGLDVNNKILFLELISLGSLTKTIVEPPEVFRMAIYKLAINIILIHNHPSGALQPSDADLDVTDRLYQVGKILRIEVLDHLIINEEHYLSFLNEDILEKLAQSTKYQPPQSLIARIKEEATKLNQLETAKRMKNKGLAPSLIAEMTGLSEEEVAGL